MANVLILHKNSSFRSSLGIAEASGSIRNCKSVASESESELEYFIQPQGKLQCTFVQLSKTKIDYHNDL